MKNALRAVAAVAATVGAATVSTSALATTSMTSAQLTAELQKVSAQTAQLQRQVTALKAQLSQAKQQQRHRSVHRSHKVKSTHSIPHTSVTKGNSYGETAEEAKKHGGLLEYLNGVTVSTSPILGLRSKYDASDLITNLPSMNEDLRLLNQRAHLENIAKQAGLVYADKPFLVLGGRVEGQAIVGGNFDGSSSSDIDLDAAELDVEPIVSRWAAGFMSIMYDDSPPISGFRERTSNSRIFLRRGFLTIGNLNEFPLYFTIGQMYAPYGRYSSAMVTAPLTLSIGRTLARTALLGFEKNGVYVEGYGFRGDTTIGGGNPTINEGGFNLGIKRAYSKGNYDIGAGMISNLGDSSGMQETGYGNSNAFRGFGVNSSTESLVHRVPAVNVHTEVAVNNWNILAEYVGAVREFDTTDLTFDGHGAEPSAMHYELIYNFPISGRPSNIGITYGRSFQALGLNVPRDSYALAFNTSIWKDTIEALEFRHDTNYSPTDTAFGKTADGSAADAETVNLGSKHSRNLVTAQIGIYF